MYPYINVPFNVPFDYSSVYREQLTSKHHGIALWNPNPDKHLYDRVSIGDVGYLSDGKFLRMFNVRRLWDDPSNQKLGKPDKYKPLYPSQLFDRFGANIRKIEFDETEFYSPLIDKVDNAGRVQAETPNEVKGRTYECKARYRGAILSLPHGGYREDVIHSKAFEDYIQDQVASWFTWAQNNKLGVKRMEDLILVTGCTLVTAWAVAAFDSMRVDPSSISLEIQKSDRGRAQFIWRNVRGKVEYRNSHFDPDDENPLPRDQCVFIRGLRAKRSFFRTKYLQAATGPLPKSSNDRRKHRNVAHGKGLEDIVEEYGDDANTESDTATVSELNDISEEYVGDTATVQDDSRHLRVIESRDLDTRSISIQEVWEGENDFDIDSIRTRDSMRKWSDNIDPRSNLKRLSVNSSASTVILNDT